MLRVLYVDDDEDSRTTLQGYCEDFVSNVTVFVFSSLTAAKEAERISGPFHAYIIDGAIGVMRGEPWADELVKKERPNVILFSGGSRETLARVIKKQNSPELLKFLDAL